ncbi:MAG: hypothetical protein HYX51_04335 [Chloroflexi bacterium]|nr:hypothetical protein [Chloroflexota bacterium]
MNDFHPYSNDDLRHIRRLILACGVPVPDWAARLRRTADYLQSLSPGQAEIVAQQAQAIAADPDDYGDDYELIAVREEIATVPEQERLKYVSRHVIEVRRRYFPGPIEEE